MSKWRSSNCLRAGSTGFSESRRTRTRENEQGIRPGRRERQLEIPRSSIRNRHVAAKLAKHPSCSLNVCIVGSRAGTRQSAAWPRRPPHSERRSPSRPVSGLLSPESLLNVMRPWTDAFDNSSSAGTAAFSATSSVSPAATAVLSPLAMSPGQSRIPETGQAWSRSAKAIDTISNSNWRAIWRNASSRALVRRTLPGASSAILASSEMRSFPTAISPDRHDLHLPMARLSRSLSTACGGIQRLRFGKRNRFGEPSFPLRTHDASLISISSVESGWPIFATSPSELTNPESARSSCGDGSGRTRPSRSGTR